MERDASQPLVEGEIVLPPACPAFRRAVARLFLEDVSRADASAVAVVTEVLSEIEHAGGEETRIPFLLCGKAPSGRAHYSIRVHIDLQGDGEVRPGDLVTKESYPVALDGGVAQVKVVVSQIE